MGSSNRIVKSPQGVKRLILQLVNCDLIVFDFCYVCIWCSLSFLYWFSNVFGLDDGEEAGRSSWSQLLLIITVNLA